jgi:hypothetical protein
MCKSIELKETDRSEEYSQYYSENFVLFSVYY